MYIIHIKEIKYLCKLSI